MKLPPLTNNSAYLKPPKVDGGNTSRLKQMLEGYSTNSKKLCGICGHIHAPGEPHKSRKAAHFNGKTGTSRLTNHTGSMEPVARTRGTDPNSKPARAGGLNFSRRKASKVSGTSATDGRRHSAKPKSNRDRLGINNINLKN